MKTIEYLKCLYSTLRDVKKEKYDYRDYKWVIGYEILQEIYKPIYIQNRVSSYNEPTYLFGIEVEIDRINPYTIKLYEDTTNKISIPYVEHEFIDRDKVKKAREEILQIKSDSEMSADEHPSCRECIANTFDCILSSINKLIESEGE